MPRTSRRAARGCRHTSSPAGRRGYPEWTTSPACLSARPSGERPPARSPADRPARPRQPPACASPGSHPARCCWSGRPARRGGPGFRRSAAAPRQAVRYRTGGSRAGCSGSPCAGHRPGAGSRRSRPARDRPDRALRVDRHRSGIRRAAAGRRRGPHAALRCWVPSWGGSLATRSAPDGHWPLPAGRSGCPRYGAPVWPAHRRSSVCSRQSPASLQVVPVRARSGWKGAASPLSAKG